MKRRRSKPGPPRIPDAARGTATDIQENLPLPLRYGRPFEWPFVR